MITESEALKLFRDGELECFTGEFKFYYKRGVASAKTALEANNITVAGSEWLMFFWDRHKFLSKQLCDMDVIPIVTLEESYNYGL